MQNFIGMSTQKSAESSINSSRTRAVTGSLKRNDFYRLRFIGESNPLTLLHGKIYIGRVIQAGWFGVVDETHDEYAYPPGLFEVLERIETTAKEFESYIATYYPETEKEAL